MFARLIFFVSMIVLPACGSDPICVFDSENASGDVANPAAFSADDCTSSGDPDFDEARRRGENFSEEDAEDLANLR